MKRNTIWLAALLFLAAACQEKVTSNQQRVVTDAASLQVALDSAKAGDVITMANGVWKDVQIKFGGKGTEDAPITLQAETPGQVFIEGESDLKFGGEYLTVSGLYFRNGYTPSNAVIDFKFDKEQVANHCRITNTVIEGFNQMSRDRKDHWVEFWGRNNQMDHCYLAGKSNEGPTVRVEIKGRRNIKNFHQIVNNHFGPRPRKGGPKGETIQLGDSFSSMSPSNTTVANNLFEECNGEVEIISSKTNFNEFRNNVFYKSEGSLVTRHGNYCTIDGNYFIGDENSENIGGIRLINTGHVVTNNYFYNLKGKSFRSPLAVMNGIPKSPLNRYNQVTDVIVAYNTYVNCPSPWQFGVGTNISQKEVLPLSEIRSARPIRTVVANNLIYNEQGDTAPVVEHDKADGVTFASNFIQNQGVRFDERQGLTSTEMTLDKVGELLYKPTTASAVEAYQGFEFDQFKTDIFGNSRANDTSIGAMIKAPAAYPMILDKGQYGAGWFSNEKETKEPSMIDVHPEGTDLVDKLASAEAGDVIVLMPGTYTLTESLVINKAITIQSKDENQLAEIIYSGAAGTPAFQMNPKGELILSQVILSGTGTQQAFASLEQNMSSHYNLRVKGCEIKGFDYVLKAYKETFAEEISFANSTLRDCQNGIELSQETNDKGDYNVEFLTVEGCVFDNVKANVIDYYRGGYDESTIGGNLSVINSTFTQCGGKESNGILLNTRGIVNVNLEDNTFKNNSVKLVALLWGAKNNTHANNQISNSGKIVVQENLKLTLVY
ncbi:chondroitinase-B domain-containing protein [Reichenbachiella sp. MSK19-1]|uniref:chondroitinase-B domain-containing protein n=1 Tax=Reichenbachiella sp. MSK19-1 TaxID=1897631 RepID=UPI000E6C8163|nr:chondroitinase-B domain-containing protein [Reichenbachiella sp. MSK19-1]RJE70716.1 alginate lyase [Reichenbachiella sp. MSK19-1]